MIVCCGKKRRSNFCPECGTDIRVEPETPLETLRIYLAANYARCAQKGLAKPAAKWQTWENAVIEVQSVTEPEEEPNDPVAV